MRKVKAKCTACGMTREVGFREINGNPICTRCQATINGTMTPEAMPKAQEYIDLTPTPDGMAQIMFTLVRDGDEAGKKLALAEITKAFRIAYAYWYPDKPEYRIEGITGKAVKS